MTGLPTIHLNGTGAISLLVGYEAARNALEVAIQSFHKIEFNSRDYYVDGPDSWPAAVEARYQALNNLLSVDAYFARHLKHIQNQNK